MTEPNPDIPPLVELPPPEDPGHPGEGVPVQNPTPPGPVIPPDDNPPGTSTEDPFG